MFNSNSLITRIAIGKSFGFIVGLTAFYFIPHFLPEHHASLKWGVMVWYITFGAIIGVFGVYTKVPVINLSLAWWFRGPYIGAWLNLVIALIAYKTLEELLISAFGIDSAFTSPFWMVLEGAIIGFVIDFFATKYGGQGRNILDEE